MTKKKKKEEEIDEIAKADDKRSARLNCITHLLSQIPYKKLPYKPPEPPKRRRRGKGVPDELFFTHEVPALF